MKTFTRVRTYITLCAMFSIASIASKTQAQCLAPTIKFENAVLVSGTAGQVGATYRFPQVTPGTDVLITVDSLVGGAVLKEIDAITSGFSRGWQPVIEGPATTVGHEYYARFTMNFVSAGTFTPKTIDCLTLSALNVDQDNVKIQDVVETYDAAGYSLMPLTEITVSQVSTPGGLDIRAIGDHDNDRRDIDTTAFNTQINLQYGSKSSVEIRLGVLVTQTGNPTATEERVFSIYYIPFVAQASLPVRLLSFNGRSLGDNLIELKWVTEVEVNNKQFEIQRSLDGRAFSTVAVVFAHEGSGIKAYNVKDQLPAGAPAKVYYRIRQVDLDGAYSLSNIITVNSTRDNSAGMKVTPNPVVNDFSISLENNNQAVQAVRIIDLSGREVFRQSLNGQKVPTIRLSAAQARMQAPGVYVAEVSFQDGTRLTQKMIRQ
jgi:hypothetical protein